MNSIQLKARAKINLSLDVTGKLPDGYHEVKMIMQTIELHDRVFLEAIEEGIAIKSNCPWVPENSDNIAYKAAQLLIDEFDISKGIKISIDKRIPVAAGLAGGSSDAAAVLKGMNELFKLGLPDTELMALGKQIGADVPYCIKGGTMLAEGIGEVLTKLPSLKETNIVLVKPRIGVSTAWVYRNLDIGKINERPDTNSLIEALEKKNNRMLASGMKNVLEGVTIPKYQVIQKIKDRLMMLGALGSLMSGSGPSVFGIFEDRQTAEKAYKEIRNGTWECFITKTVQ